MFVIHEGASSRLEFVLRGPPPNTGARLGRCMLFIILSFVPVPFVEVEWESIAHGRVIYVCGSITWWIAFVALWIYVSAKEMFISKFIFDAGSRQISVRSAGWLFQFFGRSTRVESSEHLAYFTWTMGSQSTGPLPICCRIGFETRFGSKEWVFEMPTRFVDTRAKGMDLFFRIGRLLGYQGYRVGRSDHRELSLTLSRHRSPGTLAIPELGGPANYGVETYRPRFEEPGIDVGSFHPSSIPDSCPGFQILDWRPGELVRILKPAISRLSLKLILGGCALLGTVAGYVVGIVLEYRWSATATGAVLAGVISALAAWYTGREREVIFDWEDGTALFRLHRRVRYVDLADIEELVLVGFRAQESKSGEGTVPAYWCLLQARTPEGVETLLRTRLFAKEPDKPYHALLPMMVELARAARAPFRWEEYPKR